MRKLLITGFGPFPRVPRNPSETLARAVARHPRWRQLGVAVEALVLETRYGAITEQLLPKLEAFEPDVLLMLGVAGRRRHVSIETRATNRVSRLMPDASGRVAARLAFRPGAPAALSSGAPNIRMLRAMRGRGVDARLSRDAGRYLCNASFFAVLEQRLASSATMTGTEMTFIHIPLPRRNERVQNDAGRVRATASHTTDFQQMLDAVVDAAATILPGTTRMSTKR